MLRRRSADTSPLNRMPTATPTLSGPCSPMNWFLFTDTCECSVWHTLVVSPCHEQAITRHPSQGGPPDKRSRLRRYNCPQRTPCVCHMTCKIQAAHPCSGGEVIERDGTIGNAASSVVREHIVLAVVPCAGEGLDVNCEIRAHQISSCTQPHRAGLRADTTLARECMRAMPTHYRDPP